MSAALGSADTQQYSDARPLNLSSTSAALQGSRKGVWCS
jgi:hypothetical protein